LKALVGLLLLALLPQAPAWDEPSLTTAPVAFESAGLAYAGGLYLLSSSSRLGGVSGLEAAAGDDGDVRFFAVTDAGDFAEFTGRIDATGHLAGASEMKLTELRDSQGQVFPYKAAGDAEDLSLLPDRNGFVVSFEQNHRIVAYQDPMRPDGPQGSVDVPPDVLGAPANRGMEAVSVLPGAVLAVGAEDGRIWFCPKEAACIRVAEGGEMGRGYDLTGFDHLQGGELVAVYRARSLLRWRAKVAHIRVENGRAAFTTLAEFQNVPGNLEAIATLPLPNAAGWRLYLASDNGFEAQDPTLLLAFDWIR
jgi:hypothetical protein